MGVPRILSIAGSDPSGGAGIQADVKTITALGGYAMGAITALTVQNTVKVSEVQALDPALVAAQITACLDDIGADVIKIGLIPDRPTARAIETALHPYGTIPIILDPVLTATSGADLAAEKDGGHLLAGLLPKAHLVTPNLAEAATLSGMPIRTLSDQAQAAKDLAALGARHVLVKGGHMMAMNGTASETVTDVLYSGRISDADPNDDGFCHFVNTRIQSLNTHGTGCSLAAAIATHLALGHPMARACRLSVDYIRNAITHAPGFGAGAGPLHHGYRVTPDDAGGVR